MLINAAGFTHHTKCEQCIDLSYALLELNTLICKTCKLSA